MILLSLQNTFRVAYNTISLFVPQMCQAIHGEYREDVVTLPSTPDQWREVAQAFGNRWNFHLVCSAIDGKHVVIKKPPLSWSEFFNYKVFYSIVFMSLVDAEVPMGKCWMRGVGVRCCHFNDWSARPTLEDNTIEFHPADTLPQDDRNIPFFVLQMMLFRSELMEPFSMRGITHEHRVFKYRQSRATCVVENAFGTLAHRQRVLPSNAALTVPWALSGVL